MAELTPIPAEHRAIYYDALRAGRAEAERLGVSLLDDRIFLAFHRALYRPMLDLANAQAVVDAADNVQRRVAADWHPNFRQGAAWAVACLRQIAATIREEASRG